MDAHVDIPHVYVQEGVEADQVAERQGCASRVAPGYDPPGGHQGGGLSFSALHATKELVMAVAAVENHAARGEHERRRLVVDLHAAVGVVGAGRDPGSVPVVEAVLDRRLLVEEQLVGRGRRPVGAEAEDEGVELEQARKPCGRLSTAVAGAGPHQRKAGHLVPVGVE